MRRLQSVVRPRSTPTCRGIAFSVVSAVVCFVLCRGAVPAARAGEAETISFSRDVLPIMSENCFTCHGPDAKTRKAELRLDLKETALRKKGAVIVPGKSGDSELVQRVTSKDVDELMPPPKSGKKLSSQQIATLKKWIDQGAMEQTLGVRARKAPCCTRGAGSCVDQKPDRSVRAGAARDREAKTHDGRRAYHLDPPA